MSDECVCAETSTRNCPSHGQGDERRWHRERLLWWIANKAERAAFRLTERRRGNTP